MVRQYRLALIGFGAMAKAAVAGLAKGPQPIVPGALLVPPGEAAALDGAVTFHSVKDLIDWKPDLVAECAGQTAVAEIVPELLAAGIDVVIASVGALAQLQIREAVEQAVQQGRGKYHLVSGAIGGLDALSAAKYAGLDSVDYVGRKPPLAWIGTPAADKVDLAAIREPTLLFEGTAEEACRLYPKNANVTAAVALAGVGFDQTTVRLFADPQMSRNQHEIRAKGSFGDLELKLSNLPLPENPKTSWLASLSVEQAIRRELS